MTTTSRGAPLGRVGGEIGRHWLLLFGLAMVAYAGLPWLAPVLMHFGWTRLGRTIYFVYASQCHQLPQRSYFLFGEKLSYTLPEIQAAWRQVSDPAILRQFVGNTEMGWKVAWSDRMVAMYTTLFLGGLVYLPLRGKVKPLSPRVLGLLLLPMLVDGGTHALSDLAGVDRGFRADNAWLAALTGGALPETFYAGDALGSFNSWMRLVTGVLFGIAGSWFVYPHLDGILRPSGSGPAADPGGQGRGITGQQKTRRPALRE